MPSRSFVWLVRKEWRELVASRSWWILLLAMGPLVGVSFISAVRTYAEASGLNGTAVGQGVGQAFSPLIGVWAPTFSACELAAAFLLPFVGIRLVSGDRQSGALKIELQHPMPAFGRISAKALVLLAGWCIATTAPALAIVLWKSYGGSLYPPELATVVFGHLLNAGLTIALAAATASLTEHPSTAAILTLSVTVGTWIVNFIAAVHGGVWERAAGYTPTAMVAEFQHGLIRLDVVLVALALIVTGLGLAAIWMRLGVPVRRRVNESIALGALIAAMMFACTFVTPSWDTSESRGNSFAEADEVTLRTIRAPLRIEAHLSKERVGRPPATFEPMVGTWVVAKDGSDNVIMVDGRPWVASKDNPTKLLIESARRLYGTSNEELMDNAKQFAYFPVAVLRGLDNFSNGTISVKFKTIAGDADRASGILFNVKPNGDWLAVRYNDTENNVALWEFHNGMRRNMRFSDRAKKFMLDRAVWHELKLTIKDADLKTWLDGELALEYTLGTMPGPGRNGAPPNPDLIPANNPVLQPPIKGKVGLWAKTDSTSYFKDYVVTQ